MVDMHIHSNHSDGEYNVGELVSFLVEFGIDLFSITDHDSVDSCFDLERIILPKDVVYIPGIEFSSKLENYNCHILGYNFDYNNCLIINECGAIRNRKVDKILTIIDHLRNLGIIISEDEKTSILNKQGMFGRMDLCRILMERGYGKKSEIYDKYLEIPGLISHRSSAEKIIDIINKANGFSVLAHPKEIEIDYNIDIEDIIEKFLEIGLNGIEIYNSIHTLNDVKRYLELAKKYNLITTGGSDFHGVSHPDRLLGTSTTNHVKIKRNDVSCSKIFLH